MFPSLFLVEMVPKLVSFWENAVKNATLLSESFFSPYMKSLSEPAEKSCE